MSKKAEEDHPQISQRDTDSFDPEQVLTYLVEACARYLASDGSFGLYDAGACIRARTDICAIVSERLVEKAKENLRSSAKSADKKSGGPR
jgi:hypothetical protein